MNVACYYQVSGISTYRYLCKSHEKARRAAGWTSKTWIPYVPWTCDDCGLFGELNDE